MEMILLLSKKKEKKRYDLLYWHNNTIIDIFNYLFIICAIKENFDKKIILI
jgi:hypothetical protein